MVSNQHYWKQISAYLAGHLSERERAEFDAWVNASTENAHMLQDAKKIWENSGLKHQLPADETETDWLALQEKIKSGRQIFFPAGLWLKIAAGVALVAGLTYTYLRINAPGEIVMHAGNHVMSFYLPDSTRVWLNANSTLTYFDNYGDETRRTRLSGEGYFIVRRNEENPFSVNTAEAMVHVLGTSFNIKEDTTGTTVLNVAEGRVKFSLVEESEGLIVEKDEKAIAPKNGSLIKLSNPDRTFAHWRRLRNPGYTQEVTRPVDYVKLNYSWSKVTKKRSMIKGSLVNNAALSPYRNIVLKVSIINGKGKTKITRITITDTIEPEHSISFEKPLDILDDTDHVRIEVEKVDPVQ